MKTLLYNTDVLNVYTDTIEHKDILIEDGRILAVASGLAAQAKDVDEAIDLAGKTVIPGLIDAHMHIESTMMTPAFLSDILLQHGTTGIIADPHEIANVQGTAGILAMMDQAREVPLDIYWSLPSCVPATAFDITGARLCAQDLEPLWDQPDVIALAEVMNAPGVLSRDQDLMDKLEQAKSRHRRINGHAPGLAGTDLQAYIAAGITDDHECSTLAQAAERIENGMTVFIREGTAARDLEALAGLLEEPWSRHCALCTDDRHPGDLVAEGHIDHVIRKAGRLGKDVVTAIRLATLNPAEYYGLDTKGAVAPGKDADLVILDDLQTLKIDRVYKNGRDIRTLQPPHADFPETDTMHLTLVTPDQFRLPAEEKARMRVIGLRQGSLVTDQEILEVDPEDLPEEVAKAALMERHHGTGQCFTGLVKNTGLKRGAIASSIGHDSHNLLVIGRNDADMAAAANEVRRMKGGLCTVLDGQVLASMALPVAGLMAQKPAEQLAEEEGKLEASLEKLGMEPDRGIFMTMSFMSLSVIPALKLSVHGLVDVGRQETVPLVCA